MTDIVERLRRGATSGVLIPCEDLIQAAEIIEQYRADAAYDECTINFLKAGSVAQASWMPIETSPRNGEPVLIYVPINTPDRRTLSAYWTEAGWWICSGSVVLGKPTHWMPFPVPPIPSVERKFTGPGHLEQTGYSVPSAHSGSARE